MRTVLAALLRLLKSRTAHWVLSLAFLVAVGIGFAGSVRDQTGAVKLAATALQPAVLLGAFALVLASLALAIGAWRTVVTGMGSPLDRVTAARIFLTGQLGTYLPGTGWPVVIQVHMGRRAGVSPRHIVAGFVLATAMLTSTGLTMGLGAAPGLLGGHTWWLAAPALFVVVFLCWPDALRRIAAWLLRLVRRPEPLADLSARRTRWAFACSALSWCANGLQLWVLAVSLGAPPLRALPICLGAMALAILLGSFLPTAPGGIGARELVLVLALSTVMPSAAALVVTAASRVIHTVADVLPAVVFLLIPSRAGAGAVAGEQPVAVAGARSPQPSLYKEEPMSPNRPLVSVIVPTYNCEKTLAACLDAAFAQTYPAVEVIVVDDASSDRSRAIAQRYDCTLITSEHNSGPATARNRGIAASRGEIVFFLDADVALAPDAVATAVVLLDEDSSLAGASGIYAVTPLFDDGVVERYQALHAHYWRRRNAGIVRAGYFSLGAFRRSVIDEVGAFDGSLRANFNEDTEYGYRIAERYPMLLTTAISGYHDDDDRLLPIMRKFYRRVSSVVPLVLARRGERPAQEMAHRPREVAAAALAAGSALLAPWWPVLAVPAVASLVLFLCADVGMVRFVRRAAGLRFLPTYFAIHFVLNLTIAVAAGVGLSRWLLDPRFRRLYQPPAAPVAMSEPPRVSA